MENAALNTNDNRIPKKPITTLAAFISQESIIPAAIKQRHLVASPTQKGDMYYGKDGNSFANLKVGSTSQFLSVSGGIPVWFSLFTDLTHPYKIQPSTNSISLAAAATKNQAVTFTTAFATACTQVLLTVNNSTNDPSTYVIGAKSITKTGFTIYITSTPGATTDTITVGYVAIGY